LQIFYYFAIGHQHQEHVAFDNIEDDRQTTGFQPELYLRPDHSQQRIAESTLFFALRILCHPNTSEI
jgi:hypothetical protein